MDKTRQAAVDCYSTNESGIQQPMKAWLNADGMTIYRGNTPKIGGYGRFRRGKKDNKFITNRVVGVEVACGPIDEVFLYHTDNFVAGGANTMVEILRQAIADLAERLKKYDLSLPPELSLYFDNCGENKNRIMMGYISLLLESYHFEAINMYFLIVGHTHNALDQYFGVLSEAVKASYFIGSPISLHHLLELAHSDPKKRPTVSRQISIIYDYTKLLGPYINKEIKFFQIPHCFQFRLIYGKAYMRYKLFSFHNEWLPKQPSQLIMSMEELTKTLIYKIKLPPFCTVGGAEALAKDLGLRGDVSFSELLTTVSVEQTSKISETTKFVQIHIRDLESKAINQSIKRFKNESEAGFHTPKQNLYESSETEINDIKAYLNLRPKSNDEGYIIWLINEKDKEGNRLLYLIDIQPETVIPKDVLDALIDSISTGKESESSYLNDLINDESENDYLDILQNKRKKSKQKHAVKGKGGIESKIRKNASEIVSASRNVLSNLRKERFGIRKKASKYYLITKYILNVNNDTLSIN